MDTDNDKYIFNVKTVQSGAFRILVESLKEILTDTNIIFAIKIFKMFGL